MQEDKKIAIVGLGYVGLTLATVMAEVGFEVVGIEKRNDVVNKTNNAVPHFQEIGLDKSLKRVIGNTLNAYTSLEKINSCDVYIITVGTPLNSDTGIARLDIIESASKEVADNMRDGSLVILRSTVKIGTARNVVKPILEKSGKKFQLAMCPERTLEGNALKELRELPQIVGADEEEVRMRAANIFKRLTNIIVDVSTLETAEIIKLVDNTFRDVNFGFANEVARICDAFNVNCTEVINGGKLGYPRTNVALPGLVGGPCLEKDPHILNQSVAQHGLNLNISQSARFVNENQPKETIEFVKTELQKRKMDDKIEICILGMAFKGVPETDDLRGSMSIKVLNEVQNQIPNANISLYDPVIDPQILEEIFNLKCYDTLDEAFTDKNIIIIANNHPEFKVIHPADILNKLKNNGFIYDYWNHFSTLKMNKSFSSYFAVGNLGGNHYG